MTTIKQIREKLQSTLEDVDKVIKEQEQTVDPYRFAPKIGELYWYTYDTEAVSNYINRNDCSDRYYILTGNCYRTKEQAERALEIINRIGELRGDWLPDWGDRDQRKYYTYKDHINNKWSVGWSCYCESGEIYVPTEQAAQTLIDEYGDDLLLIMRRL